ncbi:MAG: response regulator [Proteobacteria bacterium]|nr:response regulator [Pseudomonadota bacterium]MCP4918292.1 response regulator [Pseudomonadota bacterium]
MPDAVGTLMEELRRLAGPVAAVEEWPDGPRAVVSGPRWQVDLDVATGSVALSVRKRAWTSGWSDVIADVPIPTGAGGAWARQLGVNVFQTLTGLEGDGLDEAPRLALMLLDDESLLLRIMARTLSARHDVTTFSDPREALEAARTGHFDGILVDYRMPIMTGTDFIAALERVRPELVPRTCVMTAQPEAVVSSMDLVLAKPLSMEDLDEVIRLFVVLRGDDESS